MTSRSRASIHDVARAAGVSAATVSKVLRGNVSVRDANAKAVQRAVADLGYRMDPLAAGLRSERRRILGLIVPDLRAEFFAEIVVRVELLAEAAGYSLTIATSHEDEAREAKLVRRMRDWRVAGTLLAPVRSARGDGAQALEAAGMTVVLVDRVQPHPLFDTVSADNAAASTAIARRLAAAGHAHVALFALSNVSRTIRTRIEAFVVEADKLGLTVDVLAGEADRAEARARLAAYLDDARPTAIFALFPTGTLEVLSELRRRGLRAPADIALVGFDDVGWMEVAFPSISAVVQPVARIAETAFARVMARIDGEDGPARTILAPCSIIARQSCALPEAAETSPTRSTADMEENWQ